MKNEIISNVLGYAGINPNNQQEENICGIFARKVKVGVKAGIQAMSTFGASYGIDRSALINRTLNAVNDYNIATGMMAISSEESMTLITGIVSYAILFNVGPELLDITKKVVNLMSYTMRSLNNICAGLVCSLIKPWLTMGIDSARYFGPIAFHLIKKFANAVSNCTQELLKTLAIIVPHLGKRIVSSAIEMKEQIRDLMKLAYDYQGTIGAAVVLGLLVYYDMESAIDLMQWIFEQYGNIVRFVRTIDWTGRIALQGAIMAIVYFTGQEGIARMHDWYREMVQVLMQIVRYEYAPRHPGLLSLLSIIGVFAYYDDLENYEFDDAVLEQIDQIGDYIF